MESRKSHWDGVYQKKESDEVSWYQANPKTSLALVEFLKIKKTDSIIDIGAGDSKFVDALLDLGFKNISVLDISEIAIRKAQKRIGERSSEISWIVSDVLNFKSQTKFDLWHDRAAFHFLTQPDEIEKYLALAQGLVNQFGYLTIGTFSENGPDKCSGLEVSQYSESSLVSLLKNRFDKIKCFLEDHATPFKTIQSFLFCSFKKV